MTVVWIKYTVSAMKPSGPSNPSPSRQRFHFSLTTKADRRRVWETYLNLENWREFSNIYGKMKWTHGQPWTVGSRLQIEVLHPVEGTVEHSIIVCIPGRQIGWADSGLGFTIAQWVSFDDEPGGGTVIQTAGEISHGDLIIAGETLEDRVKAFKETWYENFRRCCDRSFETNCNANPVQRFPGTPHSIRLVVRKS